jgi:transposase
MPLTYVSPAPHTRDQTLLFYPTLDDMIPEDHPVRVLDELLNACDFSEWEQQYHGGRGQPPVPPQVLAKVWLYALSRRIRSSRQVEYAVSHSLDFLWLAEGRTFDHSTLCTFRTRFGPQLKGLFRQLGRLALTIGLVRLNQVTLDGTRVRANSSRHATLTAEGIEQRLKELDQELEAYLQDSAAADQSEQGLSAPVAVLPETLANLRSRQEALKQALETVRALDADRRQNRQIDPQKRPAQLPTTDGDARVMPNKEGGFAPNDTPLAAVDVGSDLIVAVGVINHVTEHTETPGVVEQILADFGQRPGQLLADGHHATGQNIAAFENSGTELLSPLPAAATAPAAPAGSPAATAENATPESATGQSATPESINPAVRPDPTQPVPQDQWDRLPRNPQYNKLDKSCFVYDPQLDVYHCPQGRPLGYEETKTQPLAGGTTSKFRVYRCEDCPGCPLRDRCLSPTSKEGRTVRRDQFTEVRDRHARKMQTPEAQAAYQQRLHSGEVVFAHIKQVLGLRQFLLRGLEKVNLEWLWTCTSDNVYKLVRYLLKQRALLALAAALEAS